MNAEHLEDQLAGLVRDQLGARLLACEPVAPGLGTRRFFRLQLSQSGPAQIASAIARVEAEASEVPAEDSGTAAVAEPPLEPIRAFLESHGIPVPRRLAGDDALGIVLLEDAGATSLENVVGSVDAAERRSLYAEACGWIPRLQALEGEARHVAAFGRRLDAALIRSKAEKFIAWALPWLQGHRASDEQALQVRSAFEYVAEVCARAPARLSHRDYKAANIHVRRERAVGERLLLIDLQGAFLAPPEYDLVCLLRDSHVALPESEVEAHLSSIRTELPDAPREAQFETRFDLLTLIRVAKDMSHYIHAASTRSDERYLPLVPNALHNLRLAAERVGRREARMASFCALINSLAESDLRSPGAS